MQIATGSIVVAFVLGLAIGSTSGAINETCSSEIACASPHHNLFSTVVDVRFEYDGIQSSSGDDWYYTLFPCEPQNYEDWPFFLLVEQNSGRSQMILNTQPLAWKLEWEGDQISILRGTDTVNDEIAFDKTIHNSEANALEIHYADGDLNQVVTQAGTIRIHHDGEKMNVDLEDVRYDDYPRNCDRGASSGSECGQYQCEGDVIQIESKDGGSTVMSCPACLRNIVCGLGGKYGPADCDETALADATSSSCYLSLQGSDGVFYQPPLTSFEAFADTWHKDVVDQTIVDNGYSLPSFPEPENCKGSHEQCGGKEYDGPTCCKTGYTCIRDNAWWSACKPNEPSGGCAALWQQCGGENWGGPTCCIPGLDCHEFNPWYSQCLEEP